MKILSYFKNDISSNKLASYVSEDVQEKKKQKYKLEKYEKFQPKKKESSIDGNESILKGAEFQVKHLLSFYLKNIEKEEKENEGNPLLLNAIERTKKNKHLSFKRDNFSKMEDDLFRKKSTGNEEEMQKLNSLKIIRNLNYNSMKYIKSNFFNISYNVHKSNRDINNNNDISHKSSINKEYKESNTKKKNKTKFNSNSSIKDVFNGLESKNSIKKIKDIKRIYSSIANLPPEKKPTLFSEEDNLTKKKDIKNNNTKILKNIYINNQKSYKEYEQNIDLNESIILNKFTIDCKGRSKDSSFTNSIRRKNSFDSQNILNRLRDIKDKNFPTRKNTTNLFRRRPKLSLRKETSISDISKITEISKSDEEIKNKTKNNISSLGLSSNRSFLLYKNPEFNKRNVAYKRSKTNFAKIFEGNVNKKELFKAKTIYKSLRKQLKKTIIFRPEDFNLFGLNDNHERKSIKIKTIYSKHSIEKNSPVSNIEKLNESISDEISNITVNENSKNEEKKIINLSLKNVIDKNELENSITDLNISKQKLLIQKNKNKIYEASLSDEKYRKLTHKGEVYDSLDDDEEDEIFDSNTLYINPNSMFSVIYNGIILFFSMYSTFSFPLYLAFTINFCNNFNSFNLSTTVDILVEIFYIIDFFLGFFKAYYNFDEQLIKKRSSIIKHYISTRCILDLLEAIPVYSIIIIKQDNCSYIRYNKNNYGAILNNTNYLLVYNKVLKFFKFLCSNEELSILINKLNVSNFTEYITLFMQIFAILSVFHVGTCTYIFIGRNSYHSWLYQNETNNKSFFDIYICSFYFLLASITSVGYGDIISNSTKERMFQIFLLVVGIIAYSWTISSFSNYVIKLNEKNITYEKNLEILNDIKLNNELLPDSLYDKIKRHLKYKQYYEKNDKNIIFDCLPIGLKNLLIYEMYKPVVKNFIFFKNFENIDFIVKVVLAFRPIIAVKNDILVNEGDMVEDLMFIKNGVLSVELPINLKNPQKNIHEYLYGDLLAIQKGPNISKIGNSTILERLENSPLNNTSQTYFLDNGNIDNTNLKGSVVVPGLAIKTRQDMIQELQEKEKERIKNTRYLRILKIRENEHFGDVLMFLEKRSPLRVRVTSKKTELFFLRKMDVVNISLNYPNIWKKINKKSVYNFEQIKKSIRKIIELYCSIRGYHFNGSDFEDSSVNSKELNKKAKLKKKKRNKKNKSKYKKSNSLSCVNINKIKIYKKYTLINKNSFNKYIHRRAKSVNNKSIPKLYNLKKFYEYVPLNSGNNSKRMNSKFSGSMSKKDKIEKQLLKTYNRQYKYYTGQNKNANEIQRVVSIIKEEPENETTVSQKSFKIKNGFLFKNSTLKNMSIKNKNMTSFNKNNQINYSLQIKENVEENLSVNDNSDNKEENCSSAVVNSKSNSNSSEKSDEKKNNFLSKIISSGNDISNNNSNDFENSKISLFDKYSINDEMKSNENILIPIRQENPLSNLKNKLKYLSIKNIKNIVSKNIFSKTKNEKKCRELIDSNISSKVIQTKEITENNESNIEKTIDEIEKSSNTLKNYNNFNILEVESSNIDFEIKSSYENINNICNNKYSRNIFLQNKLKTFLLEETKNNTPENSPRKYNSKVKIKKIRANSTLKSDNHSISRLMTYNKTCSSPKKKRNKYKTNIDFECIARQNTLTEGERISKKYLVQNKRELSDNAKIIGNKQTLSPLIISNRKKKESLLSQINFNIQTTNQRLNNPNEFYSMYFQSLLKNDKRMENRDKKRNSASISRSSVDKKTKIENNKTSKKFK